MGVGNPFKEVDVAVNVGTKEAVEDVFTLTDLRRGEEPAITGFLNTQADKLEKVSPTVASQFRKEIPNMLDLCRYMKQEAEEAQFSTEQPQMPPRGGLGINLLIPKDIEKPAGTKLTHFELDVTEGSEFYWWGGPSETNYYEPVHPDDGDGYAIYLIKNGIIHEGATPVTRQFLFKSEDQSYNPYVGNPLDDISLKPDRPVTAYETNGAFLITPEIGTNLRSVATRDASSLEYEMIGVVVYEEAYYDALRTW